MEPDTNSIELGKNRIEALSDGIFAIAMTLLILEFHVPNLPAHASNVVVVPALLRLWPKFITYAISFASLGVFWIGHHNMYHVIRRSDRVLLWLNIVFFMFVSFLPFSTSILNAFMETSVAPLFFGANLVILGWTLYAQWVYASKQPSMIASHIGRKHRATVGARFLAYPIIAMLTMGVCFWSVPVSLAIYLCLLPLYMIPAHFDGRRHTEASDAETAPERKRKLGRFASLSIMRRNTLSGVVAAAVVLAGWAAFRPELLFVNHRVSERRPVGAAIVRGDMMLTGRFHGAAHQTIGAVDIIQVPGGGKILRLTNFSTSNGPDVRVLLIRAHDATDNTTVTGGGFTEIGKLKGNVGDQNYEVPSGLSLTNYHAVTVWRARFHVNFGTAALLPVKQ